MSDWLLLRPRTPQALAQWRGLFVAFIFVATGLAAGVAAGLAAAPNLRAS
ncbi:MAG: hypothetical protein K9J75_01440 [Cyanobium usitatum Tobar12.5m-G36]|nr:hypothetical protein [Cyanobium usitatum Tobar12.5m-G36]